MDRAVEQMRRTGAEVKSARIGLAMSHRAVGRQAGVAGSTVERVERGWPCVQIDTLCAIGRAVGLDIVVRAYPGRPPSLRDSGQLALAEQLHAEAHSSLRCLFEAAAGDHGEAADMLFLAAEELVHVELERMAGDFQAQYRSAALKRDWLAARHARPVRLVIALEDTERNRLAVRRHASLIRSALPAGTREVLRALRSGTPLGRDGLIWIRRRRSSTEVD